MIVLLESSEAKINDIVAIAKSKNYNIETINTHDCSADDEYYEIVERVDDFSLNSTSEILFINFSGRDYIARFIGDEFTDMVIVMSCDKLSEYYTVCPVNTFLELMNSFEKEITH